VGRRLALLIATHEHDDPTLRRLTAPAADVEALAAVLRDPQIAGFEVTVLVNETHYRVGEAISELYRDRRRDDLTLLYFTGHGLKDDDGRLYLAASNTRRDSLLFTSLLAEQLDYAMEGCASRQKVLVLDCCYSGAFPAGRAIKADTEVHALTAFQGRGRTVLTASDSAQYSFEGDRVHGSATQSVFTRHLVEGLRDGSADLDGDGDITVDELYSYVHDRVVEEMPQQRPKKQSDVQGRIVIARNVAWTLPGYVRNALNSPIAGDRLGALDALMHLHRIGNPTVRARVVDEIERLADDDSRMVSTAATARLQELRPAPTPEVPREPEPAALSATAGAPPLPLPAPPVPSARPVHPPVPGDGSVGAVPDPPVGRRDPVDDAFGVDPAGNEPAREPVWWRRVTRQRQRPALVVGALALVTSAGLIIIPTLVPDGTTGGGSDSPPTPRPVIGTIATVGTIAVGPEPAGIGFFDDRDGGRRAAVAVGAGVTLVDTSNNVVDESLDFETQGTDVAVALGSSRTYVATATGLVEIDSAPSPPVVRGYVIAGEEVYSVAAAPDGNRVYATTTSGVATVDPRTSAVVSTVDLPGQKFGLEVSPDSARIYVANADRNTVSVIDAATAAVERTIATGAFTMDVALSPTSPTGYVAQASAIGVFATDSTTPAFTTIPVPDGEIVEAVAVTPDGRRVFAVTRDGGRVIEIDALTRTVTRMTTPEPAATAGDIAVTDDHAYVSMRSSGSLLVLDISGG
jgi:YVTN family beta-propeller protein